MAEKDPAKQTPDGQKTRPGTTPSSKAKTADSPKSNVKRSTKAPSKTSVHVSLDNVQLAVLDNLRDATSRHDYLQGLVDRYLDAANPNAVLVEDDDLPGNERQVRQPFYRV